MDEFKLREARDNRVWVERPAVRGWETYGEEFAVDVEVRVEEQTRLLLAELTQPSSEGLVRGARLRRHDHVHVDIAPSSHHRSSGLTEGSKIDVAQ